MFLIRKTQLSTRIQLALPWASLQPSPASDVSCWGIHEQLLRNIPGFLPHVHHPLDFMFDLYRGIYSRNCWQNVETHWVYTSQGRHQGITRRNYWWQYDQWHGLSTSLLTWCVLDVKGLWSEWSQWREKWRYQYLHPVHSSCTHHWSNFAHLQIVKSSKG